MTQARFHASADTVWRVVRDLGRFVAITCHSHAQLAAENLFLQKQLALYLERKIKPRRADDATRSALVALAWIVDWRRLLTIASAMKNVGQRSASRPRRCGPRKMIREPRSLGYRVELLSPPAGSPPDQGDFRPWLIRAASEFPTRGRAISKFSTQFKLPQGLDWLDRHLGPVRRACCGFVPRAMSAASRSKPGGSVGDKTDGPFGRGLWRDNRSRATAQPA